MTDVKEAKPSTVASSAKAVSDLNKKILDCKTRCMYHRVGKSNGELFLTGAEKMWKLHDDFVYIPSLRIAGEIEEVKTFLSSVNIEGPKSKAYLDAAYTLKNSSKGGSLNANFLNEIKERGDYKNKMKVKNNADNSLVQMRALAEAIKNDKSLRLKEKKDERSETVKPEEKLTKKTGVQKTKKEAKVVEAKPASTKKDLHVRLDTVKDGLVLDVSTLTDKGTGIKTIKVPSERSDRIKAGGLNLYSSNPETMKLAFTMLPESYQKHYKEYEKSLLNSAQIPDPVAAVETKQPTVKKTASVKSATKATVKVSAKK